MIRIKIIRVLFICICLLVFTNNVTNSGWITTPAKYGAKKLSKYIAKTGAKAAAKSVAKISMKKVARKYGDDVVLKIGKISTKTGKSSSIVSRELIKHGNIYKKAGYFADDAIEFGIKNKAAGRVLLNKLDYGDLKYAGFFKANANRAVKEAWRLSDRFAIGGSKKIFNKSLKKAGISNYDCNFCNKLAKKSKSRKLKNRKIKGRGPDQRKRTRITKKEQQIYKNANVGEPQKMKVNGQNIKSRSKRNYNTSKKYKTPVKNNDGSNSFKNLTNCQRMALGKAAFDVDGSLLHLHHSKQENVISEGIGLFIELSQKEHLSGGANPILHQATNPNRRPKSELEGKLFNKKFKGNYWKQRHKQYCKR
jgi:hypothetical protein